MYCLKCGKKTTDSQVFCQECQEVMQKYPVKPGTAIQLPKRQPHPVEKKSPKFREPTAGEQLAQLHKLIRWLVAIITVLSILLILVAGILIQKLNKEQHDNLIGRNYTTSESATRP